MGTALEKFVQFDRQTGAEKLDLIDVRIVFKALFEPGTIPFSPLVAELLRDVVKDGQ
jgi:hypothetical protein